jgi:hypothetical protein
MYVYSVITHTTRYSVNVILATSFSSKNHPSSHHFIRTVEIENSVHTNSKNRKLCTEFSIFTVLVYRVFYFYCSCVQSFLFLLFLCTEFSISTLLVYRAFYSYSSCVQSFLFLLLLCTQFSTFTLLVYRVFYFYSSSVQSFLFLFF